jgi:hypothetical protein
MDLDNSLLFHRYALAEVEVSMTESPAQKVVAPEAEIPGVGSGLTCTDTADELAEHPLLSVTITE